MNFPIKSRKNMLQNRSWKIDQNIFTRNAPDNLPCPLKVFPVMPVMIFPRKTMKNSCFFLPVCHCGTLYSKSVIPCARPSTALWSCSEHCTLRDRSLRPLGVGSCASSMLMTSTVTIIPVIFRPAEQLGRAVDAAAQVQILTRNVTEQDIPF